MMRSLTMLAVALLATFVAGCSTTDSRSDAERIVGVRTAETVNARVLGTSIPVRSLEATTPASQVAFGADQSFRLTLVLPDSLTFSAAGQSVQVALPNSVSVTGTYQLDEDTERVRITRSDVTGTLTLRYAFRETDDLELIAEDAATIEVLLGAAGPDAQRLAGVVQGMSIRFSSSS